MAENVSTIFQRFYFNIFFILIVGRITGFIFAPAVYVDTIALTYGYKIDKAFE